MEQPKHVSAKGEVPVGKIQYVPAEKEKTAAEKRQGALDQEVRDILALEDEVVITDRLRKKARRKYARMKIKIKQQMNLKSWADTVRYNDEVGRARKRPAQAEPA
jgi:hypothetical protein